MSLNLRDRVAKKHNLKVIYDAAHAFGVTYNGISSANLGDASMFSCHATKVFHTIEGGALCYNDEKLTEKLEDDFGAIIRDLKKTQKFFVVEYYHFHKM